MFSFDFTKLKYGNPVGNLPTSKVDNSVFKLPTSKIDSGGLIPPQTESLTGDTGNLITGIANLVPIPGVGTAVTALKNFVESDMFGNILGWECKGNASWCPKRADAKISELKNKWNDKYKLSNVQNNSAEQNLEIYRQIMADLISLDQYMSSWVGKKKDETKRGVLHYINRVRTLKSEMTKLFTSLLSSQGYSFSQSGISVMHGSYNHTLEKSGISVNVPVFVLKKKLFQGKTKPQNQILDKDGNIVKATNDSASSTLVKFGVGILLTKLLG